MKKFLALILALAMVLSLAACGSSASKEPAADTQTKLVMGTSPDYPPYEFFSDAALTEYAGIDVEVGKFIADSMSMELQIESMNFDNLVTSLGNGDFDMVIAACEYTTSGLRSRVGACHSRFRFTPAALVRRWPRRDPSGFMLGTM